MLNPHRGRLWLCMLAGMLAGPGGVTAQEDAPVAATDRLNVFLECEGRGCEIGEYRSRVPWVNWVVDGADADITVALTSESRPDGGYDYNLVFSPAQADSAADRLVFRATATDTQQDEIAGVASYLGIGLARFAAMAGFREFIALRPTAGADIDPNRRVVAPQEVNDPWNLWTFSISGSANISGTQTRKTNRFNANISANRTTPTWKLSFSGRGTINTQEIERSDGSIFESDQRDGMVNIGVTYALADHWSVDLSSLSAKFPQFNQKFRADITPGIEYSLFPYEEATRRTLTLRYTLALTYRRYEEETIYGRLEETPWEQAITLRATMRQPWGDASATAIASHILDDIDKHNISLRGTLSFRVVRGLSFNTGGDISWVTDQVYLSAGGVTDEEALLRLRTRGSDFNQGLNFGLSYQFGSIYNNTVNNRFPGVGGGGGGGGDGGPGGGGRGRGGGPGGGQ